MTAVPVPGASSPEVRVRMQRQKRRDTGPEMRLRAALHARGHRYRIDAKPLRDYRRRADIVFTRWKVAVFVDGCFWHGCAEHARSPKSNADWWAQKIDRNVERDEETSRTLQSAGWTVVRVWEHEETSSALAKVERAILDARQSR